MRNSYILRTVLAVLGLVIIALGLNVGLGGIQTLGWQGAGDFVTITNPELFAVRDSHVRFIGGVWLAVGVVLVLGAVWFARLRPALIAVLGLAFVGGLTRLSGPLPTDVLPSLALELLAFPLLALWAWRTGQK